MLATLLLKPKHQRKFWSTQTDDGDAAATTTTAAPHQSSRAEQVQEQHPPGSSEWMRQTAAEAERGGGERQVQPKRLRLHPRWDGPSRLLVVHCAGLIFTAASVCH